MTEFTADITGARYGQLEVLHQVSVSVASGEIVVLLGSNGAGKTTTLRAIFGMLPCRSRAVALDGAAMEKLPTWQLARRGIVMVPDGARCFPNLSVLDNLRGAFLATHPGAKLSAAVFDEIFELFPILRQRTTQSAGTMSGGQRQMLAVGRALMADPKVLVLDEPSAGLSPKIVEDLFEALARIKVARGCAVLMAEQNVGTAAAVADHCIVLEEGRVVLAGPMDQVRRDERLRTAYLGL